MTIFTKSETTEEKKVEGAKEETPKVVVCEADEEKHISNCGWIPMEGGNFDRPKEKRSSSFGPLSIIRLSPSPLARTPSPSPPDYDNAVNSRRMRRCTRLTFTLIAIFSFIILVSFFLYQQGLINVAYQKGVYHGWNAATYSNRGLTEKLFQNVEIDPNESYEKIQVPRMGSNRPAVFLHDFKKNLTAIVDVMGKRCFVKDLDRNRVASPRNFIDMLKSIDPIRVDASSQNTDVVRESFKVGQPLNETEVLDLQSPMLLRHCAFRPTYMLTKQQPSNRVKRNIDSIPVLQFASMNVYCYTSHPPCCRDHLGQAACQRMMNQNSRMFSRRCNTDAEFRLIQCCTTCNTPGVGIAYDLIARSLVSEHCFDRYGPQFCSRYVNKTDVFEPHNTWSCAGKNPQMAFRTCRLSCGYCNFNAVHYTLDNAIEACDNSATSTFNQRWRNKFGQETASTYSPIDVINSTFSGY
ncbi:unnamed protein product [Caenorhabditis angaria]|uniref:BRICHOS domain-containing protein n=1 Tax=Caenorhabditis angaria TaxID=860376 RepID=A0A9P1J0R6_9PELO|nr:unnamed protein product [Caenorhabditis angaria]